MTKFLPVVFVAAAMSAQWVHANEEHHKPAAGASQAAEPLSEGEVRKVDKDAQKITVRHGPLANLDMPAMTMVFQVKDAVMLDKVKTGDKVKFRAEKVGGAFTITQIDAAE
jgi:Cu(I)/Ag(I) efflux system periplasmic protein CusF